MMILKVFKAVGDSLPYADAYTQLISLYAGSQYAKNKAAGSLGGAVNGGTIILHKGVYTRIR